MPKLENLMFLEGWYFLSYDNTEPKRPYKIIFPVSERQCYVVVG